MAIIELTKILKLYTINEYVIYVNINKPVVCYIEDIIDLCDKESTLHPYHLSIRNVLTNKLIYVTVNEIEKLQPRQQEIAITLYGKRE